MESDLVSYTRDIKVDEETFFFFFHKSADITINFIYCKALSSSFADQLFYIVLLSRMFLVYFQVA